MFESVAVMRELAVSINARRSVVNVYNLMIDYNEQSKLTDEKNTEGNFLREWFDLNVRGENFGNNVWMGKMRNIEVGKQKDVAEKKFEKFIKNEKNNTLGEYNFTIGQISYQKVGDKYYEVDENTSTEIDEEKIKEKYDEYLNNFIKDLGSEVELGSVALGVLSNMSKAGMAGLKTTGGLVNRTAGLIQNMNIAITEEAGFGIGHLQNSRRFLRFDNTLKYINGASNLSGLTKLLGISESKRMKKMETLKLFANNLHLLESVLDDFTSVSDDMSTLFNNAKSMLFDFSINNPEWKNQMELLLSIMQTVKIKDKNGNEHPVFNGETQEFIYIPGTLKLKNDFVTEDNQLNWEQFKENNDNSAPQRLLVARYKSAKMGGQGNYAKDGKALIENSVSGRLSLMYVKWILGNTYRQYGKKEVDIKTGNINIEGNKRILFKHAPTTAIYMLATHGNMPNHLFSALGLFAGATSLFTLAPAIPLAIGGFIGVGSIFLSAKYLGLLSGKKKLQFKDMKGLKGQFMQKEEAYLALRFVMEIVERSINIVPQYFQSTGFIAEENIKKRNYNLKYMPEGMTENERNLLSASAMDVAQKVGVFLMSTVASLTAIGLFLLTKGEDEEEETIEQMKELERQLNMVLNMQNNIQKDIEKFTNPVAFKDAAASVVYYKTLVNKIGRASCRERVLLLV
jgi:hypothetical protein